ncbi:MAG: cytochrome c-type biogenesis protein [Hyphomicrobiaceae bacterium]
MIAKDRSSWLRATLTVLAAIVVASSSSVCVAVEPDEILSNPKLEQRARQLSAELRCLVCQNQSIDDSNAPLARDLRLLVRERLQAGDSDQAVLDFLVARYGEFVLLRPPFGWHTLLLWLAPFICLAFGLLLAWRILVLHRGRRLAPIADQAPLSTLERERLDDLLNNANDDRSES